MSEKKTILVTGAGGFIGGWIAESAHLRGAATVRAGVRTWASAARIARFPLEIVLCDIMDKAQIAEALRGADAVVHCAFGDDPRLIVDGTQNMLEVAHAQGNKRFVYISSAEVYGPQTGDIRESDIPTAPIPSAYGTAKRTAEQRCQMFFEKGLPTTILRPSIVYGPFSKNWIVKFAARLQSGNWGTFKGYGDGFCNLIYVDDLVSAVLLALDQEQAIGKAFNVNGPERVTWNQYFEQFNTALGLPKLREIEPGQSKSKTRTMGLMEKGARFFLDRWGDQLMTLYMRVDLANKIMKKVKGSINNTPDERELEGLYGRMAYYVPEQARAVLGFAPQVNLETGLRFSAAWLAHHELLKQP